LKSNTLYTHIQIKWLFTPLFICMCVYNLSAQTDSTKGKGLHEVVITGQLGENTLQKSVLKVKVIDSKRIQLQGAFNLPTLLANELNVRINYDPMLGNSISLQGISGQNIKILIDGVPVIGREGGNIDLTQINLSNVERIEMVEGPMSVSFGTDALGGVINIITKKTTKNLALLSAGGYTESIGQHNFDAQANLGFKKWGTQVNFQRNFFEGFHTDPESRFKIWKPRTQYTGDFNLTYFIKNGTIKLNNQFFHEKTTDKGVPTINPYEGTASDSYYYTRRLGSNFQLDKKLNAKWQLNIVAAYQNYQRIRKSVTKNLTNLEEMLIPDASLQDTNYFNLYMSRGLLTNKTSSKRFNYQLGYEINIDETEGTKINNGTAIIADYSLFGNSEIKIGKRFMVRPAARVIYNTKFEAPVIPSLNVKYDVNTNWIIRASYARGFRAPSLKELYLAFVDPNHSIHGNENLKAETGHNLQLVATFSKKIFKNYTWQFEPAIFYNRINNMIDLVRLNANTVAAKYTNIGSFENIGLNVNTGVSSNKVNLQVGYAMSARQNSVMQAADVNRYFYSNEFRTNLSYTFTKYLSTISVFYKYNGRVQYYQYNLAENDITLGNMADFHLMDVTANKYFFKRKLNVTIGCKNIFNTINVQANLISSPHGSGSNSAAVAMGTSYFAALKLNLDFFTFK
jgi:outer membrane receptor for ferrienterochelin and colicins